MTELDDIEKQPVFILSQMRPGDTLTEDDVLAIQAVLSELDKMEWNDIETFHNGRVDAFREIGGQEMIDAMAQKNDQWINQQVRKAMDQMDKANGKPTKVQRLYAALKCVSECGPRYAKAVRIAEHALADEVPE